MNNPSHIFRSQKLWDLLALLERKCDVLIVDSPSMNAFVDTYLIAQKIRSVLLIFADDVTPTDLAKKSLSKLNKFNVPILGAVLNRNKDRKTGYYYSSYDYK